MRAFSSPWVKKKRRRNKGREVSKAYFSAWHTLTFRKFNWNELSLEQVSFRPPRKQNVHMRRREFQKLWSHCLLSSCTWWFSQHVISCWHMGGFVPAYAKSLPCDIQEDGWRLAGPETMWPWHLAHTGRHPPDFKANEANWCCAPNSALAPVLLNLYRF